MISRLAKSEEMRLAQQLIYFAQNKCEEQQVISGCTVDENCGSCPNLMAQKRGTKLLNSMIEWDAYTKRRKDVNRSARAQQKEGFLNA